MHVTEHRPWTLRIPPKDQKYPTKIEHLEYPFTCVFLIQCDLKVTMQAIDTMCLIGYVVYSNSSI